MSPSSRIRPVTAFAVAGLLLVLGACAPHRPAADVIGLWTGRAGSLFAEPGRNDRVRLNIERVVNGQLVGSMRVGALAGRISGTISGPNLHAQIGGASKPEAPGATLDATVAGGRISGKVALTFGAPPAGATPAALQSGVVLVRRLNATAAPAGAGRSSRPSPRRLGLRFLLPIVRAGRLSPGFSTHGVLYRAQNYVFANKGATVTYAFGVPAHRTLRLGYGIPRGRVTNGAPLDILLGGRRIATVPGTNGPFHALAPRDTLLWWHNFGPGAHRLTLAADAGSLNLYGLWTNAPPHTHRRR